MAAQKPKMPSNAGFPTKKVKQLTPRKKPIGVGDARATNNYASVLNNESRKRVHEMK